MERSVNDRHRPRLPDWSREQPETRDATIKWNDSPFYDFTFLFYHHLALSRPALRSVLHIPRRSLVESGCWPRRHLQLAVGVLSFPPHKQTRFVSQ